MAVDTGVGDGSYAVSIRRSASGRVAELRVLFIPEGKDKCSCLAGRIHTPGHKDPKTGYWMVGDMIGTPCGECAGTGFKEVVA